VTSSKISDKEIEEIDKNLTDEQWDKLLDYRGGCYCHVSNAPCSNCEAPVDADEVETLGFIVTDDLEPPQKQSISDITKSFCR